MKMGNVFLISKSPLQKHFAHIQCDVSIIYLVTLLHSSYVALNDNMCERRILKGSERKWSLSISRR